MYENLRKSIELCNSKDLRPSRHTSLAGEEKMSGHEALMVACLVPCLSLSLGLSFSRSAITPSPCLMLDATDVMYASPSLPRSWGGIGSGARRADRAE